MMFWILCAILTLAAFLAAMAPFLREGRRADVSSHDIAVYKDQLAEIDADLAKGLIGSAEAENARLEVSRRLLKADDLRNASSAQTARFAIPGASIALLAIPVIAWSVYSQVGSPDLPDMPVAARVQETNRTTNEIAGLLEKAEAHLKVNPKDGKGWSVVAPIYLRMGRFQEASEAYKAALSNSAPTAALETGLGQSLAGQNNGLIGEDALAAFKRAAAIEPQNPEPRVLIATAFAQQGKLGEAKAEFKSILDAAPKDAPWRSNIESAIRDIETAMNPQNAASEKGPSEADVNAAAAMSESDRAAMIEGMVANLDQRLAQNPDDPQGWQKLVRSYAMLKNTQKAQAALERAIGAMASNPDALKEIQTLAAELGLKLP